MNDLFMLKMKDATTTNNCLKCAKFCHVWFMVELYRSLFWALGVGWGCAFSLISVSGGEGEQVVALCYFMVNGVGGRLLIGFPHLVRLETCFLENLLIQLISFAVAKCFLYCNHFSGGIPSGGFALQIGRDFGIIQTLGNDWEGRGRV